MIKAPVFIAALSLFAAHAAVAESEETYVPHPNAKISKDLIHVEDGLDYVIPESQALKFVKLEDEWSVATFEGGLTMSGTYYYGQINDIPGDDLIGLFFLPDAKYAKALPYWKQDGRVREINFQNGDAFIKAVIPAKAAKDVADGKRKSVRGRTTIVTDGFMVAVSCGAPIYMTTFKSLAVPPKVYAARGTVQRATC
jgi:hypothetical protein